MKIYVCNIWENSPVHYQLDQLGEVIPLTEGLVNKSNIAALIDIVEDTLKDFKPEDAILLNGPAILQILATMYLVKKFDKLNLLVFQKGKYRLQTIGFNQQGNLSAQWIIRA